MYGTFTVRVHRPYFVSAAHLGAHVRGDCCARRGLRPADRLRVLAAHHCDAQPVAALRGARAHPAHGPIQRPARLQRRMAHSASTLECRSN